MPSLAQAYDRAYKALLSHPAFVEALLRLFAPAEIVGRLDFASLSPQATESVAPSGRRRLADLCWRVRFADIELWILLLFEFQSRADRAIAIRLMQGIAGHWQAAIRSGASHLPAVLPIVLYNGKRPWNVPNDIAAMLPGALPEALRRFQPQFEYLLIDELRLSYDEMLRADNLLARTLAFELAEDGEAIVAAAEAFVGFLHARVPAEKRLAIAQAFGQFMQYALHDQIAVPLIEPLLDSQALAGDQTMFAQTMKRALHHEFRQGLLQGRQEGRQEGWQEGRQEGRLEGRQEGRLEGLHDGKLQGEAAVLERLLRRRFGALPGWVGERLHAASEEELIHWAEAVLSASTLAEVFAPGE